MKEQEGCGGFTLVELLVTIVIISILTALLLPMFRDFQVHAMEVTCSSNLKMLGTALYAHAADHGGSFPTTAGSYWGQQPTLIAALAPYLEGNKKVWFCQRQVDAENWDARTLYEGGSIGYYYWAWTGNYWDSSAMTAVTQKEESPWILQGWNSELPGLVLMSDSFGDKYAWGTPDDVQYHGGVSRYLPLRRMGSHLLISGGAVLKTLPRK